MSGANDLARAYALLGNKAKAAEYTAAAWKDAQQYAQWYLSLNNAAFMMNQSECLTQFYILNQVIDATDLFDKKLAKQREEQLGNLTHTYEARGGRAPSQP